MINVLKDEPFSLVLSGGGALGIAHLGVIEDMESLSLRPNEIIGTSMGGVIGACVAVGMDSKQITSLLKQFSSIRSWFNFSLSGNSIVDDNKIRKIFENIFKDLLLEQTKIPLKLIATDLLNGNKRVFMPNEHIAIVDALLATIAIPGIFKEQCINGQILGDGFLSENLGVLEAKNEIVLAIDVLGKKSFKYSLPDSYIKTKNVMDMFERSMRLLIYNQSRYITEQSNKKIYLIEPNTSAFKTFHFNRVDEIKNSGKGLIYDRS